MGNNPKRLAHKRIQAMKQKWHLPVVVCALLTLSLPGCDNAKQFVADSKEGYRIAEDIVGQIGKLSASLSTNDFAKAREIGAKLDHLLSTRVLSWYVRILAVEETEGSDAAKALIAELKKSEGLNAGELKALTQMESYFQNKTGRTGDILVVIGALAAEQKYGHGAGRLVVELSDKYRKSNLTVKPADTNATNAGLPDPVFIRFGK
jgi:hypothetical protein